MSFSFMLFLFTSKDTMSGYTVLGVMIVTIIIGSIFWKFAPKQDQTVWRSTVSLSLAMMFLMWAFTYLCQLHPLVAPRRSDMRPE